MTNGPRQLDQEEFPSDLTGHFWATSEYLPKVDRWAFKIFDYQNNVLLSGVAYSERQAAAILHDLERAKYSELQRSPFRRACNPVAAWSPEV